jgi:acid phosphatase
MVSGRKLGVTVGLGLGLMSAVASADQSGNGSGNSQGSQGLDRIDTVVVIYAENRSFDNLFGAFPGANGLRTPAARAIKQLDRDHASVLATLPPAWGGLTAAGQPIVVTQADTTGVWPNAPFQIDTSNAPALYGYSAVTNQIITRDLFHRFFENQMQIDGGKNDQYAAWGDSGGLVMGYFDGSRTRLWDLAREYTLADNFFEAAFGGSFLNHQYLICACAPTAPASFVVNNKASLNTLTTPVNGVPQLAANSTQAASALGSAPSLKSGNIAPLDYFGAGDGYRAVNTMQPAYQPSGNAPADANGSDSLYADPAKGNTLPAQAQTTIGDLLGARGISWAWYAGGWAAASTNPWNGVGSAAKTTTIYNANSNGTSDPSNTDFQAHHQPFNYYANFDPVAHSDARAQHLKDRADLLSDIANGSLPSVSFYKPVGYQNQHPGYTNVTLGDDEIVNVVDQLRHSPQWSHMLVVVTYDEFGGQFDHVAPPKGDLLGPGTRIPALIISPYAKRGYVDHTQYDTASVLRFLTRRYHLPVLPGLAARDAALVSNGGKPMGDLSHALQNEDDQGDQQ